MLELRVLNGLHRGASLPLEGDAISVGASLEADVELVDPGIAKQHLVIRQENDHWMLAPQEGEIKDEHGQSIDKAFPIVEGTVVNLKGVWLGFEQIDSVWNEFNPIVKTESIAPPPAPTRAVATTSKLRVLMIPAALLLPFVLLLSAYAYQKPVNAALELQPNLAAYPTAAADSGITQSQSPTEQSAILRAMLRARELDTLVSLRAGAKEWVLTGALNREELNLLARALKLFEQEYAPGIPIRNDVKPIAAALPFKINQVTAGPFGNIVTSEGARVYIGDSLNGFQLVAIEKDKLIFQGQRRLEVTW